MNNPQPSSELRAPDALAERAGQLRNRRAFLIERAASAGRQRAQAEAFVAVAPKVAVALQKLSEGLFEQIARLLETKLTFALQEVLRQPIRLKAEQRQSKNQTEVHFSILRGEETEDILLGQGGSVANVLSVGLRMFALATLDGARHRPFLILDEQDCWLRPDLVPQLVKIIHAAGKELGFQTVVISHHDVSNFECFAETIYQLEPGDAGVVAKKVPKRDGLASPPNA